MASLWRDIRIAARGFAKNPGFTLLAILALGLGIGSSTAMFSVIDSVVLNPFPYADSQRLTVIQIHDVATSSPFGRTTFTAPEFLDYAERNHVFDRVIASTYEDVLYRTDEGTEQFDGRLVTPDTFEFFGIPAMMGRGLISDDGKPDAAPVFVMRYKLWANRFRSDPTVLNRTFVLNGVPRTLVGIMPPRFAWNNGDLWIPQAIVRGDPGMQGGLPRYHFLLGHLKHGVSQAQATAELTVLARQLSAVYTKDYPKQFTVRAMSLAELVVGGFRTTLLMVMTAVGLLLLIGCGNVANLLLARATAREKEFALQAALGASRWRIIRQLLLESLLLALAGGTLGYGLAWAGIKGLAAIIPTQGLPVGLILGMNGRVLLFALAVAVATAFVFGLAPALQMSRRALNDALRDSGKGVTGGFRHGRLRNALVVIEVALSLALLSGAGLFIRSFVALQHIHLGFEPDHILVLRPALPQARYKTAAQLTGFYRALLSRLKSLPGVMNVAEVTSLPGYGGPVSEVDIPGKTHPEKWTTIAQLVSEDFFSTLRVQFVQGRPFTETEIYGARKLAVINQTFARKYLGTDNPVGARIRLLDLERPAFSDPVRDATFEVIGVVADLKNQDLRFPANPEVWIPYTVTGTFFRGLLVRTRQDPLTMIDAVRKEIWAIDPAVASTVNRSAEDLMNAFSYAQPRFILVILSVFAGLGLALVAIGVYSVIAYTTERQTHEIGIRMALGADRGDVLRLVVNMGLRLVGLGAAIGLLATLSLSRLISSQLWQVSAYDPLTLASVAILLFLTGTAACLLPARRATRVDPAIALRYE